MLHDPNCKTTSSRGIILGVWLPRTRSWVRFLVSSDEQKKCSCTWIRCMNPEWSRWICIPFTVMSNSAVILKFKPSNLIKPKLQQITECLDDELDFWVLHKFRAVATSMWSTVPIFFFLPKGNSEIHYAGAIFCCVMLYWYCCVVVMLSYSEIQRTVVSNQLEILTWQYSSHLTLARLVAPPITYWCHLKAFKIFVILLDVDVEP